MAQTNAVETKIDHLQQHQHKLGFGVRQRWEASGFKAFGSWEEIFGSGPETDEIFMAWNYACYVDRVAAVGKAEYNLPMFVNAWLSGPPHRPDDWPSGGPLSHTLDIWLAGGPPKRLVGWVKVELEPGETREVMVTLDAQAASHLLSYWNVTTSRWQIATGDYQVYVGASSRDIRLTGSFRVRYADKE